MQELKVKHIYLAKGLPARKSSGMFSSLYDTNIEKGKEIEKVYVEEVTETCYRLSFIKNGSGFYVEKSNENITYLEDLGVIAE